jgi:transposase
MTPEERLIQLEEENRRLQEQLAQRDELISSLSQRLAALEEQRKKNSRNSGLPPSSDRFVRQPKSLRPKSGKKSGGQKQHPGSTLSMSEHPDEVCLHTLSQCPSCQGDLQSIPASRVERRQIVDLPPIHVWIQEHQAEEKECPHCQSRHRASFPAEVRAPVQYGSRIGALALYLVEQQLLPWARVSEVLSDVLGIELSQGSIATLIQRCAENLAPVEEQLKGALTTAAVIHQDETGLYVKGKRHWLHVSCTPRLTHYGVHVKRGQEALNAIGILPQFQGTSVHDGWRSYFRYDTCSHALCNVHHLRELTFMADTYQQEWAASMIDLLLSMKERVQEAKEAGESQLDPLSLLALRAEYDRVLAEGWQSNPPPARDGPIKPHRKRHPAVNLLDRLQVGKEEVLAFLSNFAVPFSNNQAERDIRMVKVQQKVSGSFRSDAGVIAFCRIRGYLSTLRKQGLPLLAALQATLHAQPMLPSFSTT